MVSKLVNEAIRRWSEDIRPKTIALCNGMPNFQSEINAHR